MALLVSFGILVAILMQTVLLTQAQAIRHSIKAFLMVILWQV